MLALYSTEETWHGRSELGVPVAELFRSAVRERYLMTRRERRRLVDEILGLDLPAEEWEETEAAILEARGDDLP